MALLRRYVQRRRPARVHGVHRHASGAQIPHDLQVPELRGNVQRRGPRLGTGPRVPPGLAEVPNNLLMAELRRKVQRRRTALCNGILVGAHGAAEVAHNLQAALLRSSVQRHRTDKVRLLIVCSSLPEALHQPQVATPRGQDHGRVAVRRPRVVGGRPRLQGLVHTGHVLAAGILQELEARGNTGGQPHELQLRQARQRCQRLVVVQHPDAQKQPLGVDGHSASLHYVLLDSPDRGRRGQVKSNQDLAAGCSAHRDGRNVERVLLWEPQELSDRVCVEPEFRVALPGEMYDLVHLPDTQ
mmetsp:Transcript_61192/g.197148  ORF Transcript_61192/g.197148 Transcript_61192/m.197148 type:complete len:299 (+) Transcript_61192:413-1309(+)